MDHARVERRGRLHHVDLVRSAVVEALAGTVSPQGQGVPRPVLPANGRKHRGSAVGVSGSWRRVCVGRRDGRRDRGRIRGADVPWGRRVLRGGPIHGSMLRWEASRGKVRWGGKEYSVPAAASPMNVRILVDRSGIEMFEKHSGVCLPLTARFSPDAPRRIDLRADGDGVVRRMDLWRLREMSRGSSGARDDDPTGSSKSVRHPDPESPHGSGDG